MKTAENISCEVDSWIIEEELPVRPGLKVIKGFDPYEGMHEEEIEAYRDFMSWYLAQEHSVLLLIPPEPTGNFWPFEIDEFGNDVSAFSTMDFARLHPDRFNKYAYRIRKVMKEVKEFAFLHSCISSSEGRANVHRRYQSLIEHEFRERLLVLVARYRVARDEEAKLAIKRKIAELTRRILQAKRIWERWAPWDA